MTLRSFRDVRGALPSSDLMQEAQIERVDGAQGRSALTGRRFWSVETAGRRRISRGDKVLEDASVHVGTHEGLTIHDPEAIAARLGGINIKTLMALIRTHGLETTTLGYTEPARKGGRPRRLWGMTDAQLEALLAVRASRNEPGTPV